MAVTSGHGNPNWTREEVILALDLYFACSGNVPGPDDDRVKELSELLRSFPHHAHAARRPSFRNTDGVAFKLQNLRQVATGKGLGNVSKVDRTVWQELGDKPARVAHLAALIRAGLQVAEAVPVPEAEFVFNEGRVVTEVHVRREREPKLRHAVLEQRKRDGALRCEICRYDGAHLPAGYASASFEVHHLKPLSTGEVRETRLADVALLCANCHRLAHKAIALTGRWLSLADIRRELHRIEAEEEREP